MTAAAGAGPAGRRLVAVMVPTYDEAENIGDLVREILALPGPYDWRVVVADDDSPDGTWRVAQEIAAADPRVVVVRRMKRRGRGAGGIDGFKAALALRPDFVVEMDADFSHPPRSIPALVAAAEAGADVVLGSRFVAGGKDADRSVARRFITRLVRVFIRRSFRTPVKDVSSGFRCFRREALERLDPDDLISTGPSIVLEILAKSQALGLKVVEVPIEFVDRARGQTKLTGLTLVETLVMALKFRRQFLRPRRRS